MKLAVIILVILASCLTPKNEMSITADFKLEVVKSIALDPDNNITPDGLVFSDIPTLGPPHFPNHNSELHYLMEVLNESDSNYIIKQFRDRKNFTLSAWKSDSIQIIPLSESSFGSPSQNMDGYQIDGYYSIEMPVFNKQLTKVYIRIGYLCGNLCGNQFETLYEWSAGDNKWIKSKELGFSVY